MRLKAGLDSDARNSQFKVYLLTPLTRNFYVLPFERVMRNVRTEPFWILFCWPSGYQFPPDPYPQKRYLLLSLH